MKSVLRFAFSVILAALIIIALALVAVRLNLITPELFQRFSLQEKAALPLQVDEHPLDRKAQLVSSYADVVSKVAPAVVNVFSTKTVRSRISKLHPFLSDPFLRQFFGAPLGIAPDQPSTFQQHSLGSGVVVSKDGYILTNNHVVDGASQIMVNFARLETNYKATIVGRDPQTDIAVLKIDAKDLPTIEFADSDQVRVGDVVLAVGNPFGVGQTVTMGIVSAVRRSGLGLEDFEDFIQTDAAINPGNSGGPLVDAQGRLVGLNTAIVSGSGGNQGIGFAIPGDLARTVLEQLIKNGKVVRGYLGISIQDLNSSLAKQFNVSSDRGALVANVAKGSAAADAGIKSGDVIVEFNGAPVENSRSLKLMVGALSPDSHATVKVWRDGQAKTFSVTLKETPGENQTTKEQIHQNENGLLSGVVVGDLDDSAREQYSIPAEIQGALVVSVEDDSFAAQAGIEQGDVLQEVNHKSIQSAEQATDAVKNSSSGEILLKIWRGGASLYLVLSKS